MRLFSSAPTYLEQLWDVFAKRAYGAHARTWLAFFSFSESSFFVIPPELLLLPMIAAQPSRWLSLALLTAWSSVAGAAFGYVVAYFFFDTIGSHIIALYHLEGAFRYASKLFEQNNFWVMFTAAFTPIPFKVFVLAGGFFKVPFIPFLLGSAVGRILRYLLIAYGTALFGPHVTRLALRYAGVATLVVGVCLIVVVYLLFFR